MNIDGTIGNKYQGPTFIRPYDFGTDAIERQRVSLGQSLIDADFEYGLQATKWQSYSELRRFPSFFETPGSDLFVANVSTDAATLSNITLYFSNTVGSLPPPIGSVVSVSGLANANRSADRAEGFFLVTSNVGTSATALANTCNYISKGAVTTVSNIQTAYSVIRRGGIFNNSTLKIPVATIGVVAANVQVQTSNAHGLVPGTPITANNSGQTFNGNFFVTRVTSSNTFNVDTTTAVTASTSLLNIYMNPYSYVVHRPFDGGVLMSPGQPSYGASVVRQSKKVFRYQSGKGLLWSSGTLFCPNNDIAQLTAFGTTPGSNLQIVTDISHGVPQFGATLAIKGISTPGINGTYNVTSVIESTTLNVQLATTLSSTTLQYGNQPRFVMANWHGASVRAGCFDDQNGLFWEWDGQTLFAVKRSCTFQLAGSVTVSVNSQIMYGTTTATTGTYAGSTQPSISIGDTQATFTVTAGHSVVAGMFANFLNGALISLGSVWVISTTATTITIGFLPTTTAVTGVAPSTAFSQSTTRFQDQLRVNDKFVLRGMTHQVTSIQGQGILTFNPPYRGSTAVIASTPVKVTKIVELRTPQSQFNRDPIDGTGPSGFKVDLTKMQMVGIQYTWYGAGFVDFMMRGADGNFVYAHRYRNNNINDEAYMRTGNMPVRYELINETQSAVSSLNGDITASTSTLTVNDPTTYFPTTGTLAVDNELIRYTGKTTNAFTGCVRPATIVYNTADSTQTFSGQDASTHLSNTTVTLISQTCTPSLTHWGSALLMDGSFDSDRGYFFNYANTAISVGTNSINTSNVAFAIRLAPSVSNGVVGDIGARDLLNRAQLLLQKLEITSPSGANLQVTGVLNPTNISFATAGWTKLASQPSFAQIYDGGLIATGGATPGEQIFSTISQGGNQSVIDLTALKEMTNTVIGGNQVFPDGPDTLAINIRVLSVATGGTGTAQVNLFWSEAQA